MTFITDRNLQAVQRVKAGATDEETLLRGTLRPADFARWKEALETVSPGLVLPIITKDTQMNCTNPTLPITNFPEWGTYEFEGVNDCWYYWKAIDDLRVQLPADAGIDLTYYPSSMENLTFTNVNTLEAIVEYFYNTLNKS